MLLGKTDGHVGVQDAEPHDDIGLELVYLLLDLDSVRDEKRRVVKDRARMKGGRITVTFPPSMALW